MSNIESNPPQGLERAQKLGDKIARIADDILFDYEKARKSGYKPERIAIDWQVLNEGSDEMYTIKRGRATLYLKEECFQ